MTRVWTDEETVPFQSPFYDAWCTRVVDGDTFYVLWDVGADTMRKCTVRLIGEGAITLDKPAGVDAWEMRGPERERGMAAKQFVLQHMDGPVDPDKLVGTRIRLFSQKGGSRGSLNRWLCVIFVRNPGGEGWISIGDALIEEGHAEIWTK